MPEKKTVRKAQAKKRKGLAPSSQAGEFVKEEIDHIREGKHGAKSPQQAIAIGLSKARQSGVKIPDKKGGRVSKKKSNIHQKSVSAKRSKAAEKRLKREPRSTVSSNVLSMQAHRAAMKRSPKDRSEAAKKAAATRKKNAA
jgi:hypothetical protein